MDEYYVYAHIKNGSGKVFYIGSEKVNTKGMKTKYPRAYNFRQRSKWWVEEYLKCNKNIRIKILSIHKTAKEVSMEEVRIISKFGMRYNKTGCLVNRKRISIVWDDKHCKDMSRKGEKHHNWGKTLSKEICLKKSKALMGENHHLFGKKLSQIWVDNIRKSKWGKDNPMYGKTGKDHPMSRQVINIKTSKAYESVDEAAVACGFKMKTLYNWLSGHRPNKTDLRFA